MNRVSRACRHWLIALYALTSLVPAFDAVGSAKQPPTITAQPQSVVVITGDAASFSVSANGTAPLYYQWRKNAAAITGATARTYSLTTVTTSDAAGYDVVVHNAYGTVTSSVATLTVWVPPAITAQPLSRTNIFGTDASFSVTASGTPPPDYQWQFNGAAIPGATGSSLVQSAVSFNDAGGYRVVLTNVAGAVTSTVATLTVVCPAITVSPATLPSGLVGNAYNENLTASGGLSPYTFAVTVGTLPSGLSLSDSGVLTGMPAAVGTSSFTVTAWDTNGCSGTQAFTLAVSGAPPVIAVQPQSRTNIIGTDANFSVMASGTPPPAYQWQFNGAAILGATGSSLVRSVVSFADAGGYRVVLTNVAGAVTSAVATLTVVCPAVTVGPVALPSGLVSSPYSQSLTASGGWGTYTFAVTTGTLPPGLNLSSAGVLDGTPSAIGTNSFAVTAWDTNGCPGSQAYSLAVMGAPPVITLQPVNRTNVATTAATFTATATGTAPLSYQWQFNGVDLTDSGLISGARSNALVLAAVQPGDAGSYTLVVSNVAGMTTSAVATLTVMVPPAIHAQPASRSVPAGANAAFGVTASGTAPLSYQWQFNGIGIAGATGVNLILSGVQPTNAGNYSVVVTNVAGSVTSTVATLTVTAPPTPPSITVQPASLEVVAGPDASFSVTASGSQPLGYQWQFNGGAIAGATNTNLTLSNVQPSNAGSYAVAVTNVAGSVTSAAAVLTVLVPPVITAPPASAIVVAGANVSFGVAASGTTPLSYQWRFNGVNLGGATGTNLLLSNVQPTDAGSYTVVVSNGVGVVTSAVASLTVNLPPVITGQPASQAVLAGTNVIFLAAASGTSPLSYQWRFNGTNLFDGGPFSGATAATLSLSNAQPANAGSYSVVVANVAGSATSAVAVLTVVPLAACVAAADGLVGWWPGDGNANDIAGTNNGTLQGGATASAAGVVGSAFRFDGTNGYVQIPDSPALKPTNLTVEAWVSFSGLDSARSGTAPAGNQYIVFKQNSLTYYFEGYSLEKFRIANGDAFMFTVSSVSGQEVVLLSKTLVSTSVWYHVAAVRGSNYTELYVNGQLEGRTNVAFAQDYGNLPLYFGTSGETYWDGKLRGLLDEVSLYNGALSSNEVAAVYAAGAVGKCKAPGITAQPQSQAAVMGSTAVFTVTAKGFGSLSYQWRFNGANMAGAASADLTLNNVQPTNVGSYTVVVTNSLGSVTSTVASLTVWVPPVVTVQPQSCTNLVGTDASFSVMASGTPPPAYQWQFNGTAIPGATGSSLAPSAVSFADAGGYRVMLANAAGVVTSAVATLTVVCPAMTLSPESLPGGTAGYAYSQSLGASGGRGPYTFAVPAGALPTGLSLSSIGVLNGTPAAMGPTSFTMTATDTNGCLGSQAYILAVTGAPPIFSLQPQSRTNAAGTAATFTASATGTAPLSYQWRFNGVDLADNGLISGARSSTLGIAIVQPGDAGSYTLVVSNIAGVATSTVAALTVMVPPAVNVLPASRSVPPGTNVTFSVTASGTLPLSYQWQFNGTNIAGASEVNLMLSDVQLSNAGNYTVVVTNVVGSVTSTVANLTVTTPPSITVQPASLGVVAGSNASFSVIASGTQPLSYQWQFNGGTIVGATSTNLTLSNVQPTNAGSYTVVVTNLAGSVTSAVASLTVLMPPVIALQPASLSVVAGTDVSFSVIASGTPPLSYQWTFNGGAIAGATGSTLAVSNAQLSNAGDYAVVVANVAGSVTSAPATLTVVLPAACVAAVDGLVGWWPGDGNANDIAGANNGTLQGGATASASGLVGSAFRLDGTNGYVQIPDYSVLRPTNLTIEAWVRFDSLESPTVGNSPVGEQFLVFKEGVNWTYWSGFALTKTRIASRDVFTFEVDSTEGQSAELNSATLVVTGAWYHVAGVRGSNFIQLYVNGQLEGQTNVSFPQSYGDYPLYFGTTAQPAWDHKFAGTLDEVSLYSRALSSNQIAAIYAARADGKCKVAAITAQPQSRTVVIGANVSFSVSASGLGPLAYQWQRNGVNLANGGNVSGASSPVLSLANVQTNDAGNYQVVVTNSVGSVTSAVANLTVVPPSQPGAQSAGALVLVNSQSARYLDFQHFIQPYLDNFGFPYTVQDISTIALGSGIGNYAAIIIGHSELDINHTYLNEAAQTNLSLAVSNGTGLVNFDNDLSAGGVARYQFVQDIFGFSYGSGTAGTDVSLPATEPSSQMHYITARHPTNDSIAFRSSLGLPGLTVPARVTVLALSGGKPLVAVATYGQGRAVQWGSYGWMVSTVLGPVDGLDDVVWRGVVWTARKPFVMRGLPHFVTMRVDDVKGPFDWIHAANVVGFKPFVSLFISDVVETSAADLNALTTSGKATASIHSFDCCNKFFYFNHATETAYSDLVQSNNFYLGTQWHLSHGIPISKVCAPHYSEIGPNCFAGLKAWGIEFVPIEVVPGTIEYATPGAPWVANGPYRLYETPQPGQVPWPTYYADWLTVPGHPEFDEQFFNVYSEVRDVASCGEWCPDNDVGGSSGRATQIAKRALDSMVMSTIFAHDEDISLVSTANWQAILQGITNNLASYDPLYVTLDYASQYVRATRTSRLVSSAYDPDLGQVTASFTGRTDLDTGVYVFYGADGTISSTFGTVPAFSVPLTNPVVVSGPPAILNAPSSRTNHAGATAVFSVGASGAWPLSYQWYRNGTNALSDNGEVSGARSATLTISNVLGGDAASYIVVVTNLAGSVTSSAAILTVVNDSVLLNARITTNGTFGFTLSGTPGLPYLIEVTTNLREWAPLASLTNVTGQADFTDAASSNSLSRFYRARSIY